QFPPSTPESLFRVLGPQLPFSFTDAHSLCLNLTVKSQARPEHPWYEVQGSVDKKPFLQYDSDSSKVRPLGLLGKKVNATKAWTELTQMLADVGQELRMILPDIKLENNMTKGPPTLHKLLSCQCEAECRQMTLFFDAMKISWTVVNPGARGIKEEWESKGMADYFRRISMGDCNQWLQEFLEHWEKMLEPSSGHQLSPSVGI
uniref:MHC class I-like antigen recognition-like domain-containing protein n=2 Tax=Canis lupus familiaris TaxID=9615 RepID=A0A8C0YYT0_CANLF